MVCDVETKMNVNLLYFIISLPLNSYMIKHLKYINYIFYEPFEHANFPERISERILLANFQIGFAGLKAG